MAENPKIKEQQDAAGKGPSQDRRRLLKAAAASAPVIATLPSGAAFANASASQCIIADRQASNLLPVGEGGDWIVPAPNVWVRISADFITVKRVYRAGFATLTAIRQYYLINFGGNTYYYASDYINSAATDVWNDVFSGSGSGDSLNTPNPPPTWPTGNITPGADFSSRTGWLTDLDANDELEWKVQSTTKRNVLLMFVENGPPPVPTDGVQFTGIYPNAQRTDGQPFVDNMGITESCLCSVDPQYKQSGFC